jgi:hypothetical protein
MDGKQAGQRPQRQHQNENEIENEDVPKDLGQDAGKRVGELGSRESARSRMTPVMSAQWSWVLRKESNVIQPTSWPSHDKSDNKVDATIEEY